MSKLNDELNLLVRDWYSFYHGPFKPKRGEVVNLVMTGNEMMKVPLLDFKFKLLLDLLSAVKAQFNRGYKVRRVELRTAGYYNGVLLVRVDGEV